MHAHAAGPFGDVARFSFDGIPAFEILSLAYDVARDRATWGDVAGKLSELLHGQRIMLFVFDARSDAADLIGTTTPNLNAVPQRFLQIARRHGRRLRARLPSAGLIGTRERIRHYPAIDDLATWQASLEPDSAYVAGHALPSSESLYVCLACGPDDAGDEVRHVRPDLVNVLLSHIARALEISRWLGAAEHRLHTNSQILDRFPIGIIQLDRNGGVVELNAPALRLAQFHKGLTITTAGVHAVCEVDEIKLQKAIIDAINSQGEYCQRLSIRRRRSRLSSVVVISTERPRSIPQSNKIFCVLFVTDPENRFAVDPLAVVELLGLSPAEARVAASLAMGTSLTDTAAQIGITINTARTLLARARARTGTNSQVSLIRLIFTALIQLPSTE